MDEKAKKIADEFEQRDYIYVYFIENHIENSQAKIELSKNYLGANDLKIVNTDILDKGKKYLCTIYRFRIYPTQIEKEKKTDFNISIRLTDKSQNKFDSKIMINRFDIDTFVYDLKFDSKSGWTGNIKPPSSFALSYEEQFNYYVQYLRIILKLKQSSKQNEGLILSTLHILSGEKKYTFSFLLMVLMECNTTKYKNDVLLCFEPEKIDSPGTINDEKKMKQTTNALSTYEKKPEKVLQNLNENEKLKLGKKLFGVILLFNYIFHNNRMNELLNNDNEEKKNYIYQALLDLNLPFIIFELDKEQIKFLINKSQNSKELNIALSYSKNVQEFLSNIMDNVETILKLLEEEEKKYSENKKNKREEQNLHNQPIINVDFNNNSKVKPKKTDNLEAISQIYIALIEVQNSHKKQFILFNESFFNKYIQYFGNSSLDNMFLIHKMITFTKMKIKNSNLPDTAKKIHEFGLSLAKNGKLKNLDMLDFLSKDDYYTKKSYSKDIYRPLDIFDGLDISS